MLKRALIGCVVAGLLLGWVTGAPAQAAGTKIGFVDVQKILVKSVSGIAAREQLEKERGSMQKDLEKKEFGLTQKILQEIQGIVERFGKQKGFLFIAEKRSSGLIYGDPESDVTDEIIKLYDQEHAKPKK